MSRSRLKKLCITILKSVFIGYAIVVVLLMIFERTLIYPIPDAQLGEWEPSEFVYDDVWLTASDGTKLHGWYLPRPGAPTAIVFFHGNGEHVAWCGPEMSRWRERLGVSVLVMDFRGYGKSEGKPSEGKLVADGVLAAQWLAKKENLKPSQLVLWGRSIGGGVAAGVAVSIKPQAMVMECTFDSLANVAASHVRWAPVRWLMSNQYPSAERLKNFDGDYVQWHGEADQLVPLASAERLFAAVGTTQKSFTLAKGAGHNDESSQAFKLLVRELFERLKK